MSEVKLVRLKSGEELIGKWSDGHLDTDRLD